MNRIVCFLAAILIGACMATALFAADRGPNVLFIAIDDLNDWTSVFDKDNPIRTPNLERLAQRGMFFTRAYCVSAACNPSRAGTLTGLRPATSGVYGNKSNWREAMPKRKTIMQRFMDAGYAVRGAGKIFHHHWDGAFPDDASFDDCQHMRPQSYPPEKLNGAPDYADGSEELYDHDHDPNEWTNLASNPDSRKVMDDLAQWLPSTNAKPCADLKKPEKENR